MKRAILIVIGLVVLLAGGLLVAPGFIEWDGWRESAESRIKTATGFDARIEGGISLRLLPSPSLSVADVRIGPPGEEDPIVSFDQAAVHVRFMPLLQGRIEVESVSLIRPRVHVLTLADGQKNWITPEIAILLKGSAPASPDAPAQKGFADLVSLDHVGIEGGAFRHKNLQTGDEMMIDSVNATLRAESLAGPFSVEGRFSTKGLTLAVKGKTGRIEDTGAVPLDLDLSLPEHGTALRYAGLASLSGVPGFQGETTLSLKNPAQTAETLAGLKSGLSALKTPLEASGLVTFADGTLAWKDLTLSLGEIKFSGQFDVTGLKTGTPDVSMDLKATTPVDLDAFLPAPPENASASRGFLPPALKLPDTLRGQIKLSAARASYGGQSIKGLSLVASARPGSAPSILLEAAEIPGKTTLRAQAGWKEDSLDLSLSAQAGYLPETLRFLLGKEVSDLPAASLFETGATKITAKITPTRITIGESTLTLNDMTAALKGHYALAKQESGRADAGLVLTLESVDADALVAKLNPPGAVAPEASGKNNRAAAKEKAGLIKSIQSFALPFDLAFDLGAQTLTWKGQKTTDARLAGTIVGQALTLDTLGAQNWYGASLSARGKIGALSTLGGIDLTLSGSARNAQSVLDALELDSKSLPRPFGAAELAVRVEGDAQALRFTTNLKALRGSAEASGGVSNILEKPTLESIDSLAIRVSHPNLGDLLRMVREDSRPDRTLDRPLDFYAKLDRKGDAYTLSGLKANLGPMAVSGDLGLSLSGARPALSGKIQTGSIPLDALLGAESSRPSSPPPRTSAPAESVHWSRNAIDTGWMRVADIDLDVRATRLVYKGWDLSDPSFKVSLKDGLLSVPDLKSGLFNGTLALSATVRSAADPRAPMSVEGKAAIGRVGVEPLIHALTGGSPLKASGNVSLNTDIAASGVSMAALVFDLSGKGDLSGKDIVLEGVDLPRFARALSDETKPGDTLEGLWKGARSGGVTRFDTLAGEYVIEEGVIKLKKLLFDGPQTSIDTTGTVNLPRWSVDLKNRITLKEGKALPPFDVSISGPLDNPGNTFGAGVMQDYFSRKINRKLERLFQDKIGLPGLQNATPPQAEPSAGSDNTAPEQQPAASPKPEDLFKDVLRGLAR